MRVAVIGSRNLKVRNIGDYLPEGTDEIISGGAVGIDSCARDYALKHGIKFTEIKPDYDNFGHRAPLVRNEQIIKHCDIVIAIWDGYSRGTWYTIDHARRLGIEVRIFPGE